METETPKYEIGQILYDFAMYHDELTATCPHCKKVRERIDIPAPIVRQVKVYRIELTQTADQPPYYCYWIEPIDQRTSPDTRPHRVYRHTPHEYNDSDIDKPFFTLFDTQQEAQEAANLYTEIERAHATKEIEIMRNKGYEICSH